MKRILFPILLFLSSVAFSQNVYLFVKDTAKYTARVKSSNDSILFRALIASSTVRNNQTGTQPLSTLSQSGATTNQVPQWNGSAWIPATVSLGSDTNTIKSIVAKMIVDSSSLLSQNDFYDSVGVKKIRGKADSIATINALALKAPLASPVFTGVPKIGTDTVAKLSDIRTIAGTSGNTAATDSLDRNRFRLLAAHVYTTTNLADSTKTKDSLIAHNTRILTNSSDIAANTAAIATNTTAIAGKQDALPSQTGNSGKVLGTNGSALSWVTQTGGGGSTDTTFTHIYNVEKFGANGADASDDRSAVQSAINAASAAGGGIVYFPVGTWRLSQNGSTGYCLLVPDKVLLVGAGNGSRIANTDYSASTFKIANGIGFTDNVVIKDLFFNPTVARTYAYEIEVPLTKRLTIKDLAFGRIDSSTTGVNPTKESNIGKFIKIGTYAASPSLADESANVYISNITGFGCRRLFDFQNTVDVYLNSILMDANYGSDTAIYLHDGVEAILATNMDLVNSQFNGSGITLFAEKNVNYSNFTNCYFDTHGTGVLIKGDCKGLEFVSCWTSARPNYGALVTGDAGSVPVGISFNNCTFTLSGKEGVRLEAGKGHSIINCKFPHSGYNTSGLSCIYVGNGVTQTKIIGNYGSNTMYPSRLPSAGATKGIDISAAASSKIIVDQNDFSDYTTAITTSTGQKFGSLNMGVIDSTGGGSGTPPILSAAFSGSSGTAIASYAPETGSFSSTSGSITLDGSGSLDMPVDAALNINVGTANQKAVVTLGTIVADSYYTLSFNEDGSNPVRVQFNSTSGSTTTGVLYIIVDGSVLTNSGFMTVPIDKKITASIVNGVITATFGTATLTNTITARTGNTFRYYASNHATKLDDIKVYAQ